MTSAKLLVIDDDPGMHALVQDLVQSEPIQVLGAKSLQQGVQTASQSRIDVIILDHSLPDGEGIERIAEFVAQDRLRPILYITAHSGSDTAIEAIKRGAFEFLSKPVDFGLLRTKIREALDFREVTRQPVLIDSPAGAGIETDVLVGRCRGMQEVYKSVGRLASLSTPVLIEGEVGTGKEMIARAIHQHGPRADGPFCKVAASDVDSAQWKQELFGSGGRIRETQGGTLFLEGLKDLPLPAQSRLLRYLKDGMIDDETISVRMIISTSEPSRELVQMGRLRSDLYYVLSPFIVRVPALRQREDDFDLLVSHFVQRLAKVSATCKGASPARVSSTAMQQLKSHDWPGNIAELKSVLQAALMESHGAVLATESLARSMHRVGSSTTTSGDAELHLASLSCQDTQQSADTNLVMAWDLKAFVENLLNSESTNIYEQAIAQMDQRLIQLVMDHTKGNRVRAAKLLGITRTSLRRKMNSVVGDGNGDAEDSDANEHD